MVLELIGFGFMATGFLVMFKAVFMHYLPICDVSGRL